ncbi:MAG: hypothetical protein EBT93_13130, partial [Alphaproteobacteria bacterium]|nr:hypothetical protein [Alphaproteobacteria bacterium]
MRTNESAATKNQLILTFSEDIQIDGGLLRSLFSVVADGRRRAVYSGSIDPADPTRLILQVSTRYGRLDRAKRINITYTPPTTPNPKGIIQSAQGVALESFSSAVGDATLPGSGSNPTNPNADTPISPFTFSSERSISRRGLSNTFQHLILTGTAEAGYGNTQDNTITGNDADNTLDGLAGADTMIGKGGNDTYFVDSEGDVVTELANEGTDTIQSTITYTLADNLENLTLLGSAAINGTGNSANNILTGNAAANVLNGNGGTDSLIGGRGNDTYIVDSIEDIIIENGLRADVDSVQSSVSWILGTNLENLILTGSSDINGTGNNLNNAISGNSANNILDGGNGGTDHLTGLEGADIFRFSTGLSRSRLLNSTADHITDFSS